MDEGTEKVMPWSLEVKKYIEAVKSAHLSPELMSRIVSFLDFTRLHEEDTGDRIATFLEKAHTPFGDVAAVCVYPQFVRLARASLSGTKIKVVTVANFPKGSASYESVLLEIAHALSEGAQEIDVVFPYTRYLANEQQYAHDFVASCKAACGDDVALKVILETGALGDLAMIADASKAALTAGADFIKTSTGKIAPGATLEVVATILLTMQEISKTLTHRVGIKPSGFIRTWEQAAQYVELTDNIMGYNWVTPATFRIGTSKLVDEIN